MNQYDALKLENQLCFPLYAAAKEVVRLYTPYLSELDLTYTQYIVMMLVWEKHEIIVKDLVDRLFLDTGTLTPLLKNLERKGIVSLHRTPNDRRSVMVKATDFGMALREKAVEIPYKVGACLPLDAQELQVLHQALYKILGHITPGSDRIYAGKEQDK